DALPAGGFQDSPRAGNGVARALGSLVGPWSPEFARTCARGGGPCNGAAAIPRAASTDPSGHHGGRTMRAVHAIVLVSLCLTAAATRQAARASSAQIIDFEALAVGATVTSAVTVDGSGTFPVSALNAGVSANATVVGDASLQSGRALGVAGGGATTVKLDLSSCIPGTAGT